MLEEQKLEGKGISLVKLAGDFQEASVDLMEDEVDLNELVATAMEEGGHSDEEKIIIIRTLVIKIGDKIIIMELT